MPKNNNKMSAIRRNIPNFITCMNMLSGTLAVVFAFRSADTFGPLTGYQVAFCLIGAATVFDFFDGFAARALHAVSSIGKELDSLSDLVSFGIAPTMLVFNMMEAFDTGCWAYAAMLVTIFGGLRLARFNVDTRQTTSFIGMPIPSNAIFWIGYCAIVYGQTDMNLTLTLALIVILSGLMVAPLPMFSLKFKHYRLKGNIERYLLIAATVILVALLGVGGLAWVIALYVAMSVAIIFLNKN